MSRNLMLGVRVRSLRRRESLTQVQLAEKLEISPSYLNLIEHDRRPLTAPLLIKLAQLFQLDVAAFASADDGRLTADLLEAFGDPIFEDAVLSNQDLRELATSQPDLARAVRRLYDAYIETRESAQDLATRLTDGQEGSELGRARLPSEEVSDLIQRHFSHFPELEAGAERLWHEASLNMSTIFADMAGYLRIVHGIYVRIAPASETRRVMRRLDRANSELVLSEMLPPRARNFQLAHQIGLLEEREVLERLTDDRELSTAESRTLARVVLANYFAGAVLMPYEPFLAAARSLRYDLELLAERFAVSFEQICHRLASLRRVGNEGVPFHMIRVDPAGNISKRFSASGIRFPRFGSGCPRWDVYQAFLTPGQLRIQISEMPDGGRYFCVAKAVRKGPGGFQAPHTMHAIGVGCEMTHAKELIYADAMDLSRTETVIPIGTACRLCERLECAQRAFPAIQHPLRVDEDVRGISPFAPAE
jgi:predicted transcriptional regulator/DNA-binding XRE family transcriptional regulator